MVPRLWKDQNANIHVGIWVPLGGGEEWTKGNLNANIHVIILVPLGGREGVKGDQNANIHVATVVPKTQ